MFEPHTTKLKGIFQDIGRITPMTGFDRPRPPGLRAVFLCMTPRSGSTYLSALLQANGLGRSGEHAKSEPFRIAGGDLAALAEQAGLRSYQDYVWNRIERFSEGDVFMAKADWPQFAPLYYSGAVAALFSNARYIYLTREDMMAQAVSRYISSVTGYFHSIQPGEAVARAQEVPLDHDLITRNVKHLVEMKGAWDQFFAAQLIRPLRVTYEQLDEDPLAVLRAIFAYVDLPLPDPPVMTTPYSRVSDARHDYMRREASEEAQRRVQAVARTLAPRDPA
jgi:LPS sulfotransferase NodH